MGNEATGHMPWFERLRAELRHELGVGHAAKIRAQVVRKQKTDTRDAASCGAGEAGGNWSN